VSICINMALRKNKGLRAIYSMNAIQELGMSLVGIFIPIYFLTIGYSLEEALMFFIINYIFVLIFSFVAIYLANLIGLQRVIVVRYPFLIVFLISMVTLEVTGIPLGLIALFNGIQTAFYFTPLHIMFAQNAKLKSMGDSMGKYFAWVKLVGLIGPFVGGLIAFYFGFPKLFIVALIILGFSVLPIITTKAVITKFSFKLSQGKKLFKKYPKYFVAEVIDNFCEEADGIIWPIFIFLTFASIISVGTIGTLVGLGAFLFTVLIGKASDKYKKEHLIKAGAISLALVWLFRFGVSGEISYYLSTLIGGFVMMLFLIPFHSRIYSLAKRNTTDEFLVFREVPVAIGRIIFLSLALLMVNNLAFLFPIVGIAYLYFLFL